jgi:myosin-5
MEEKLEVYTKGTKAWFKDKEEGYVVATMVSREITDKLVKLLFMIDATSEVLFKLM